MSVDPRADDVGRKPGRWASLSIAAIFDPRLSDRQKIILAAIASYADKTGHCWPSIGVVAERLAISRRTVERAISQLEICGYLIRWNRPRIDGRGGKASNGYLILFPKPNATKSVVSNATPDCRIATPETNSTAISVAIRGDKGGVNPVPMRHDGSGDATESTCPDATELCRINKTIEQIQSEPDQSRAREGNGFPEETGSIPMDVQRTSAAASQAKVNALVQHISTLPGMTGLLAWEFVIEAGPEVAERTTPGQLLKLVAEWQEIRKGNLASAEFEQRIG